ncbi:NADH-ubiquinone oxidoreductase-F iron-sulfur binding region domain-containing protein [Tundrisphaera lichenicola]|uniref:NADH-ubiquinone oxidoreductase-F iron-sulfur binding region domain-containing protein n=1 Tax=Tundrisphaera lichenicola TaxID=2029860 RepID=UPI003EBAD8E0
MIVQQLREIQHKHGWLPERELRELSDRTATPLHRIHEVASFFPHYRLKPGPTVDVKVCRDMACHLRGGPAMHEAMERYAAEVGGGEVKVEGVSCLGQCDSPPALAINDACFWGITASQARAKVRAALSKDKIHQQHADRSPLGWKIDIYDGQPRYEAVRFLVSDVEGGPSLNHRRDQVIESLKVSNLRGMGGAGFPTHLKWSTVRTQPGPEKYVVCNADESEPGTFKDRELIRRTPHLLVEGMILAGLVVGATRGFIYCRHEYEEEIEVIQEAIEAAYRANICGDSILGSNLSFALEVYVSPGGYICGEETALLEAMEDRRGEPRNKPPFPVFSGLYSKPTVINNVETLCWTPGIAMRGGEWYRDGGTRGATGLRFVSISGDVNEPGVYEVPFGQTVRELVFGSAGGMLGDQKLKAIATSGPSGGFLPAVLRRENLDSPKSKPWAEKNFAPGSDTYDILDLPLDLQTLGEVDNMLGAAFVAVGSDACMVDFALNCVRFYRNESCGKCVPCRVGSQKLTDILDQITQGKFPHKDLKVVDDLAQAMSLTSICGLGQIAANPMKTLMKHFPEELEEHLKHKRCPAGVCFRD